MIWREKRILLIALGVLLAVNTVFFFTYRVQYETRLKALDERLQEAKDSQTRARAARVAAERQYASYLKIQRDVQEVYDKRWSTQAARLTAMIVEVKRLAVASSLVPKTYSFDQAVEQAQRGTRTATMGTTTVGISFSVEGTYEQVRRLVNLLELSPQFIIIDRIAITSRNESMLALDLHVKTLFRNSPGPVAGVARQNL